MYVYLAGWNCTVGANIWTNLNDFHLIHCHGRTTYCSTTRRGSEATSRYSYEHKQPVRCSSKAVTWQWRKLRSSHISLSKNKLIKNPKELKGEKLIKRKAILLLKQVQRKIKLEIKQPNRKKSSHGDSAQVLASSKVRIFILQESLLEQD